MRRYMLLLLILLILPLSTRGENAADRLTQLDIISQYDTRLQDERYYYKNMYFRIAGCLPASVTNAVASLLATPDTNVPELMLELRNGMLYDRSNKEASVELSRLPDYLRAPRESAAELRNLLQKVSAISYLSQDMCAQDPSVLLQQFLTTEEAHPLLIRYFYITDSWPWLINMAGALCELGHPDARFVLCSVGVGTVDTNGPFHLGQSGHYATLYFQADEFYNKGTFYLLDSYPRALHDEIYGFREVYPSRYPFIEKSKHRFNDYYTPTRISDTVIQFDLLPKELEFFHTTEGIDRTVQLLRCISPVTLFSNPYYMLYIP